MTVLSMWKDLAIVPATFDLVYVQFNIQRIYAIPDKLKVLKNDPFLQGNALRAVHCFAENVQNLKNGFETNEHYLKHLRMLVELIPELLLDDSKYDSILKLNVIIAEFISIHSRVNHIANLTSTTLAKKKMLGDYLIENGYARQAQVDEAFEEQKLGQSDGKRLGDILLEKGIITRAQLDEAIELQMLDSLDFE